MWQSILPILFAVCTLVPGEAKLTFENQSNVSIPLQIPGVMNPNLSPKSKSGVTLKKGQEVFFKYKGKKTILLKIKDEKDGDILIINELIEKRIAEMEKKKAN